MAQVQFTIYGRPIAKGRPRFQRTKYGVKTFTPDKTAEYENLVKISYQQEFGNKKLSGQIGIKIAAYFPIPKSTSKKQRGLMMTKEVMHTKRPDIDNLFKAIADGLNGVAFDDDSQICIMHAVKFYGEKPRVEVGLWEIGNEKNT